MRDEITVVNIVRIFDPVKQVVAHVIQQLDYGLNDEARLGGAPSGVMFRESPEPVSQVVSIPAIVVDVHNGVAPPGALASCKPSKIVPPRVDFPEDLVPVGLGEPKHRLPVSVIQIMVFWPQFWPRPDDQGYPEGKERVEGIVEFAPTLRPASDKRPAIDHWNIRSVPLSVG